MFLIKQNDELPNFQALLRTRVDDQNPQPVDLTGATVKFKMQSLGGGPLKVDAPAVILDAITGSVSYEWVAADTDTVGQYRAEFEVTFLSGRVLSFPTQGFLPVQVMPSI
jgi:hypothetical protein